MGTIVFRKNVFIILLIILFIFSDILLTRWDPVNRYPIFGMTDYSRTKYVHPEKTWKNVFFGSSIVIAGYREDMSTSGLVNMGIDYGTVKDLEKLLKGGFIKVDGTLLLGMNYMTLMDPLPTNPYYPWHRKFYEPYLYFYRTPVREYLERDTKALLQRKALFQIQSWVYDKEIYHGRMKEEDIKKKFQSYEARFGMQTVEDYRRNLASLQEVINISRKSGIKLKCLWMPIGPEFDPPRYAMEVKKLATDILETNGVEYADWTRKFGSESFFDPLHISWENGAPTFTKEVDQWLGIQ